MKIIVAGDHSAVAFKKKVIDFLKEQGITPVDVGVNTTDSVDYPDVVETACRAYTEQQADKIILICGTGIGVSIAANKTKGILCALLHDSFSAQMAMEHNHVNCIALGARVHYPEPIEDILLAFLKAVPQSGRHQRRVNKISNLEK